MRFATLVSSSGGNAVFVRAGNTRILIDAGVSASRIVKSLTAIGEDARKLDALLITHEHSDHVKGVGSLCKRLMIPVYASPKTLPLLTEVPHYLQNVYEYNQKIGDIDIEYFAISHDAVQPVGMVFAHEGKRLGLMTDSGRITKGMVAGLTNLDGFIVEANHSVEMLMTGPYPHFLKRRVGGDLGHMSNEQTAELLKMVVKKPDVKILLAHLSESNNLPSLALREVKEGLVRRGFDKGISIAVAPAEMPSDVFEL